jgi:hypothetical protein
VLVLAQGIEPWLTSTSALFVITFLCYGPRAINAVGRVWACKQPTS